MPNFALLHSHEYNREVSLLAFDLLEFGGTEVRKQPLVERKDLLADLLKKVKDGVEYNGVIDGDLAVIFDACKLEHEGIVVKRKDLLYESGRSSGGSQIKIPSPPQ
jgi:bifunctional non-homologous end joining protein LigD